MLTGKGWFIWQIPRCAGGEPAAIAARAAEAGCTHVLIKIAERTHAFGFDRLGRDLAPPVVAALRARGVAVWGWHYVYGDNPVGEASAAVQRVKQLGLDGYVIDAEQEYKHPGKAVSARMFMNTLRQGLPQTPLALSSYRFPSYHQQLPWAVFLEQCDYAMPQVYWEGAHNPAQQLERCAGEFANARLVGTPRPLIPTGAAYGTGQWRATAADVRQFLQKAIALKLPAANLYSWDFADQPGQADLWEAAASVDWPAPKPELDVLGRWAAALNAGDVEAVLALYAADAAHVTPTRTRVGLAALRDWYTDLLHGRAPGAAFTVEETARPAAGFRRFTWRTQAGAALAGEDILGLRDGRIAYHTTSLTSGA
jgi:hypothetical protein